MKKTCLFCICVAIGISSLFAVWNVAEEPQSVDPDYAALLNLRLDVAQEKFKFVEAASQSGGRGGSHEHFCNAKIAVANAQVVLYRYTGKQKELIAALEEKLKSAKSKQEGLKAVLDMGVNSKYNDFLDSKIEIAEAEYELKKAKKGEQVVTPLSLSSAPAFPLQ
jgi:hypothetical protein